MTAQTSDNAIGQLLIDGEWVPAVGGETYDRHSPVDGSLVSRYANGQVADAQRAINAARLAFDEGTWRHAPVAERVRVFKRAAALLQERSDDIADVLTRELAQPRQKGQVARAAETLEYYAHVAADRRDEAITEQRPDAMGIIAKEPVGVVGGLPAWNAPMSVAHKVFPGLVAGCTVVLKPAHLTPGAILMFGQVMLEAGLPPGVLNIVTSATDNGALVGQEIASSPDVDMITFTGSASTARAVMSAASINLKKLTLELGGKSPHIVFDDVASLEDAVDAAMVGVTMLTGQACQSGSRLLLQESIKDEFLDRLVAKFEQLKVGDPREPSTDIGPLISQAQLERVTSLVDNGKQTARLVTGGDRVTAAPLDKGYFFQPTIFDEVDQASAVAREEVFGPVLSIITFKDLDDALRIANDTIYGLASGVWTQDIDIALTVAKRLRAGTVWVNSYRDSGLKEMPLGGYKQSGVGREHGHEGLDGFLETKSIHIKLGTQPG